MTYKFLLKIFLTSLGLGATLAPIAIAQERPECYIIDNSGQLTNLTDICNVNQKRSPQNAPANNVAPNTVNNNTNVINLNPFDTEEVLDNSYILGENIPNISGTFDSLYYIDNEIGSDYTAYIRRYRTSSSSIARQTRREQIFQFDRDSQSLTSIIRRGQSDLPFIIYRYPI
jgi:hypothetical protein